jgi:Zn-finger nucleic acid-binding protein
MKCPDCGQDFVEVSVSGFDKSFRCKNCGGFWMEGWVANRVAEGQMNDFPELKVDINKFAGRTNTCPTDKAPLFGYNGDEMPPEVVAFKCSHCGWWWFPDGNLQKFKKAYDAKKSYLKFWKKKSEAALMVLPVIMVLTLVVGLGASVVNITRQQQTKVQATLGDANFRAEYLGDGRVEVRFKYEKMMEYILYKELGSEAWSPAPVAIEGEGWYKVTMTGLKEKQVYQMQIEGKRFYFQTE